MESQPELEHVDTYQAPKEMTPEDAEAKLENEERDFLNAEDPEDRAESKSRMDALKEFLHLN